MNTVFLIGNLTKTPENKTTPNGISVTTFTLAVSRKFDREKTDFFNVVTWRGLADNCARYLVKGQKCAVTGEVQNRTYTDKDGNTRYITEVIADNVEFLGKPQAAQEQDTGDGSLFDEGYTDIDECLPF